MIGFGQDDCGEKPNRYRGNTNSTKFKEYKKKLAIWNDCVAKYSENYYLNFRSYLDSSNLEEVEGVYEGMSSSYKWRIGIRKINNFQYDVVFLEKYKNDAVAGDLKMRLDEGAVDNIFAMKYFQFNNKTDKGFATYKNGLFEINRGSSVTTFMKLYPKLDSKNKRVKNGEWAGNGSGIIISKSGYIITNHHVIDDADDIEVEFILDDEVQKFNAEIVQSDKVNDLAIIKIVDVNFDGVKELPYNFKTRSSDVGTKVYAFGYPMALSIMGKEIKVTDGIISSKTGFDGDITTYQISAAIQGGNSGGPLFDDKGNFIGINAAKLNVKIADNVGYSIKTSYVLNLIDILPKSIALPSNKKLASLPLTEQIKEITKYVVLIKVK